METLAHTPRGIAGQPTQPIWIGINHIALVTPDLDATVRFYGQLLGLQLIAAMARRSARLGRHVMFDAGGAVLHFFESPEARIFAPPVGHTWTPLTLPGALQHVALQVPSKDALLTLHSTLEQAGVTVGAIGAIGPLETSCSSIRTGSGSRRSGHLWHSTPCPTTCASATPIPHRPSSTCARHKAIPAGRQRRSKTMRLNHLNLCVDNLADAREFFERLFDFQFVEQKGDALAVMTDRQGFTLVLSRLANATPISYPKGFHVGFIVETPGHVDDMYKRLAAADVRLDHEPRKARGSYAFYFTALNSILFEVSCPLA